MLLHEHLNANELSMIMDALRTDNWQDRKSLKEYSDCPKHSAVIQERLDQRMELGIKIALIWERCFGRDPAHIEY